MSFVYRWKFAILLLAIAVVPAAIALTHASTEQLWSDVADPHVHKVSGSLPDFVSLADKLSPAVVNIASTEESHASAHGTTPPGEGGEGSGDPLEQFGQPFSFEPHDTRSMGSGFVINPNG